MLGGGNPSDDAGVIIIATGSELQLAVEAKSCWRTKTSSPIGVDAVCPVVRVPARNIGTVFTLPLYTFLRMQDSARVVLVPGAAVAQDLIYKFVGDTGGDHLDRGTTANRPTTKTLFPQFGFTPEGRRRRGGTRDRN